MNKPGTDASRSSRSIQQSHFIIILLSIVGLAITPTLAFAVATSFEWSMPDRLLENTDIAGADTADPIPKYDPTALLLPPDGWLVNFDACAMAPGIVSYAWFVDGVSVGVVTECAFSHKFPEESTYRVSLEVSYESGPPDVFEQDITVQDWLIIALGDSYASGEGNPEKPITEIDHIDFSALTDLVDNVKTDLQTALDQLPGLEEIQLAKQQLRDDAQAARDQRAADLAILQQDLQELIVINTNVENDPVVTTRRNAVIAAQQNVANKQAQVNADQQDYNNCSGFFECAARLAILEAAKVELAAAKTDLVAKQAALLAVRSAVVVIYSAVASYEEFTLLLDAKNAAVNAAQGALNTAQNAYQNAADALQQAVNAVTSLQSLITDLQQAWEDAKTNALTQYLDSLPVWTGTPPSWAGPEPTYTDIVLNHKPPGEAMRCHRSMISGQARAALAIEQADPHTSVTFVHLSCSGARIDRGLVQGYGAQSPVVILKTLIDQGLITGTTLQEAMPQLFNLPNVEPQVCAAANTVRGREVDAIVTSIGGNDLGFSDIVTKCITGEPCHDPEELPPSQEFTDAQILAVEQNCSPGVFINFLFGTSLPTGTVSFTDQCLSVYDSTIQKSTPGEALDTFNSKKPVIEVYRENNRWKDLHTKIEQQFPVLVSQRIYFTEYPDPTSDDVGNYCSWNPSQATTLGEELKGLPGVTESELYWADHTVAASLRNLTQAAADFYQWVFVTETEGGQTISSESKNHGYCADDHWVVTLPESLLNQNDYIGIVHPNRSGHEVYKRAIYNQLKNDFYPTGLSGAPRAPDSTQIAPPLACEPPPPNEVPAPNEVPPPNEVPAATAGSSSGGSPSPLLLLFLSTCWYMRKIRSNGVRSWK